MTLLTHKLMNKTQVMTLMSKKKDPTTDDTLLFRRAMEGVKIRKEEKAYPYQKKISPRPILRADDQKNELITPDINSYAPIKFEFRGPGIQHKVYQNLQKGAIKPEATLDMHGMRINQAFSEFTDFFHYARKKQIRCVRIIHGKGHNSVGNKPILKENVYVWLKEMESVLAFVSAPNWDGGSGATYVLLSKKKTA